MPRSESSRQTLTFSPRLPLFTQALIVLTIPLAVAIGISLMVNQLMRGEAQNEALAEHSAQSLIISHRLLVNILNVQTGIRGYVITGDEQFLGPYTYALNDIDNTLEQARTHWQNLPERMDLVTGIEQDFNQYRQQVAEPALNLRRQMGSPVPGQTAAPVMPAQLHQLFENSVDKTLVDRMRATLSELQEHERRALEQTLEKSVTRQRQSLVAALSGPLLAGLFTALLLGALIKRVSRATGQLATAVEKIEAGNLATRVEINDTAELAALASGFNNMAAQLEHHNHRALLFDRMNRTLQSCRNTEEAYDVAASYLPRILANTCGCIGIYRSSRDMIEPRASWGDEDKKATLNTHFEPDACWALRSGYNYHYQPDSADVPCRHLRAGDTARECLCVPMRSADEVHGVLILHPQQGPRLAKDTPAMAALIAETLALCIANLHLRQSLRDQALLDPLTETYNRRFLDESMKQELARSQRNNQPFSFILLDVDHFKRFNDTWGHDAGDTILISLARVIRNRVRQTDMVCRMGGEEFAVVLPETTREKALELAEEIRQLAEAMSVTHHRQKLEKVTLSLGVATYPEDAVDIQSLIKAADEALYRAKNAGRNRIESAAAQ